jgi:hypothetical protein
MKNRRSPGMSSKEAVELGEQIEIEEDEDKSHVDMKRSFALAAREENRVLKSMTILNFYPGISVFFFLHQIFLLPAVGVLKMQAIMTCPRMNCIPLKPFAAGSAYGNSRANRATMETAGAP